MPLPLIIAIDGPVASGKSTLGKRLADKLGYVFFDTGVMYRAVTWAALHYGIPVLDADGVSHLAKTIKIEIKTPSVADGRSSDIRVDGIDITWAIRSPEVEAEVSLVSTYPGVRKALTDQQRRIGKQGRIVMVGRDIGTVVMPEADLKIYLDASAEARARRRYTEVCTREGGANYTEILDNVRHRDHVDSTRQDAPLRLAADAVCLNTEDLDADAVLAEIERLVDSWLPTTSEADVRTH